MLSKRKQVYLAVAGSVGIHLAVLFAWALSVQWFPTVQAATSQVPDPVQVEVVEQKPDVPPTPSPESAAPTPTPALLFKDTDDLTEAARAPKEAVFQSDRNAEAASELPATGDQPLPTQKGKQVPRFAFDTQPYTPGDDGGAAGQNVPENMPPPPVRETAPPPPRPVSTPRDASTPPPASAATPAASVADPRDLAMVTPQSIPSAPIEAEPNPYDPSFRPPTTMTEPPRPTPVPRRGGYRPQQERTEFAGGISQVGTSSVASEATPKGRYMGLVIRTIDHRWRQFYDARADLVALGSVRVHFTVDRDGKIRSSQVVSNTANEVLASITLRAIVEAPIPPMPDEVVLTTNGGQLPLDIVFNSEAPAY